LRFTPKKPVDGRGDPKLPACVVRGAAGAVIENVLPSLAHFEMKRDKVCQTRMEGVRGVRDHKVGHDNRPRLKRKQRVYCDAVIDTQGPGLITAMDGHRGSGVWSLGSGDANCS